MKNSRMFRRIAALVLAGAFAAPAAFAANFSDMKEARYAWAADAVDEMNEAGYINGYEDGTYRPDNEVTRQECISLFSRAMGAKDSANAAVLDLANETYGDMVKSLGLPWGQDEIAYMLYKGALNETDLTTYLKADAKSKPMPRYEAAIIITKAMNGAKQAEADRNASLTYKDATSVPASAVGYVKYASDNDILKGMDDGTFSPRTSVTRAQIAVMLSRVVEKCDYNFTSGKLMSVNTSGRTVTVKEKSGSSKEYPYDNKTISMRAAGELYEPDDMVTGVNAIFGFMGDKLISIDAVSSVPDETIVGKYQGKSNSAGKLFVSVVPNGETKAVSYECVADVAISFDDTPATINSFTQGDTVQLQLSGGKVDSISGSKKETKITGATITDVSINPELTVTISHANEEYDGMTFTVSDKVIVKKNNLESSMDQVYAGDRVTLTLEYGVIKRIDASSTTITREGTIKEIVFSDNPTITVSIKGEDEKYSVTRDCDITVNGEKSDLYSFRVGDTVVLTLESDAVKKIKATSSVATSGSFTGVVTSINTSYGFINIDLGDGSGNVKTIFCSDKNTKFITLEGEMRTMSKIKAGDTVQINGTESNGAFVAKLVLIMSSAAATTN